MLVMLDNGHGVPCAGKRSPDCVIIEAIYTREIVAEVYSILKAEGYDVKLTTPELQDIPLKQRVNRINAECRRLGYQNVVSVSVHLNAAKSDGQYHNARGWSSFVGTVTSDKSKDFARMMWEEAIDRGLKGNRWIPKEMYLQKNLSMCNSPACPAILVECAFMDNKEDEEMMLTEQGRLKIINTVCEGIRRYVSKY